MIPSGIGGKDAAAEHVDDPLAMTYRGVPNTSNAQSAHLATGSFMGGRAQPNGKLIEVMARVGASNSGLANRVRRLGSERGMDLRTDHITVQKWRAGAQPRSETAQLIAEVLSQMAGESIPLSDIGLDIGADEPAVSDALLYPAEVSESIGRLGILARRDLSGDPRFSQQPAVPDAWTQPMLLWMLARPDAEKGHSGNGQHVGMGDVAAVKQTTRMFLGLDFQFGGGHARSALAQYFANDVVPLLRGTYSAEVGTELYGAAAEVAELLGWTAYDLGRHGVAQRYLIQSLRLAQAAGDRTLAARVMASLSHQANYLGRFQIAAQLARAAQEGARGTASPAAMTMFLAMEARALAGAGDQRAVSRVLQEAESTFERCDPNSEPDWISYFDQAELAGEAAHCFRDLKIPARTHEFVSRAVELTDPAAYARTLAFVRLVQAAAHVHQKEPERAATIARDVVEQAGSLKSERYRRYIRDLMVDLEPHIGLGEVRELARIVRQRHPAAYN